MGTGPRADHRRAVRRQPALPAIHRGDHDGRGDPGRRNQPLPFAAAAALLAGVAALMSAVAARTTVKPIFRRRRCPRRGLPSLSSSSPSGAVQPRKSFLFLAFASLSGRPETSLKVVAAGLPRASGRTPPVVRALLAPALVSLFGRWNWWLPVWAVRPLGVPPCPARTGSRPAARRRKPAGPHPVSPVR